MKMSHRGVNRPAIQNTGGEIQRETEDPPHITLENTGDDIQVADGTKDAPPPENNADQQPVGAAGAFATEVSTDGLAVGERKQRKTLKPVHRGTPPSTADEVNGKFNMLTPGPSSRDSVRSEPVGRASFTIADSEKAWYKLHGVVLGELEGQGVRKADLFKLTAKAVQLGKSSKLAEVLSGQLMGVAINNGIKTPWELSASVVPFHISAALALTSVIVKKPIVYDRFYKAYFKRVDDTVELMEGTDGKIEKDVGKILQNHAKQTHHWIAGYYDLSSCFKDDLASASGGIQKWTGKLFEQWDDKIKIWWQVVIKKRLANSLRVTMTEVYSDEEASNSDDE